MKKALVLVPPLIGHIIPMMNVLEELKDKYEFTVINTKKYKKAWESWGIKQFYSIKWHSLNRYKIFKEIYFYYHIVYDNMHIFKLINEKNIEFDIIISDIFLYVGGILAKKFYKQNITVYPSVYMIRKVLDDPFNLYINFFPITLIYNTLAQSFRIFLNIFFFFFALKLKMFIPNLLEKFYIRPHNKIFIVPEEFHEKIRVEFPKTYLPYTNYDHLFFTEEFVPPGNGKKNIVISLGTIFNESKRFKKVLKFLKRNVKLHDYNLCIMSTKFPVKGANIYFYKNCSMTSAISHADILIIHGGINSILTYLNKNINIPVLIFPQGAEQYENAKHFYRIINRRNYGRLLQISNDSQG